MHAPRMRATDFNLLVTLDVLLAEGSVAGAARRLRLSPSAMTGPHLGYYMNSWGGVGITFNPSSW